MTTIRIPARRPASAALRSAASSPSGGAVRPGRHWAVTRICRTPASWAIVTLAFAAVRVACLGESSATPTTRDGPPAAAGAANDERQHSDDDPLHAAKVARAYSGRIRDSLGGYAGSAMATEHVERQLKGLPAKPGVYLFRDGTGEVLYVGKAKSLRPRVRSYFQRTPDTRAQIAQLPARVEDVEVIVTGTEAEALHLEQNLVKRHRPPFNIRLRDDKSFPYIAVTVEDDYPRVMFTRERHRRGVWYFGPYANAKKVRETLDVLNRVFQFRPCEGPKPGRHSGIPCLDYHIERCRAPCVGYVSKEEYRAIIDGVVEFLGGRVGADPGRARGPHARGRARGAVRGGGALPEPAQVRAAPRGAPGGRPALGRHGRRDRHRRRGRPGRRPDLPAPRRQARRPAQLPPRERGRAGPDDGARGVLRRVLRLRAEHAAAARRAAGRGRRRGARGVPLGAARRRASRCAWPSAARSGACRSSRPRTRASRSRSEQVAAEQKRQRRVEALEELREVLNLESLPLRIECFDISNIQGEEVVGSMVVFQDARAEEGALPQVRGARRRGPGRLRLDGGGRLAPVRAARRRRRRTSTTSRSPRRRTSS